MTGPLRIGTTIADSTPEFTPRPRPPRGAPNVVVIVLDDLGFGQLGCYGSDIATPTIDGLASDGLRFNRFHVTALCSPTRAALLTGRNHHSVGMGFLTDVPIGFPGYDGRIPPSAATLPRILRDNGYATFAVGKWHLAPRWEQSAAGPFGQWPLGLGFERYYGFLGGDANQWTPELVSDNGFVDPPTTPEAGYHLTEDLVDRARRLILDQQHARPGAPFFLYFAPGAVHAPHQAPREWIDRYRGHFDAGWDAWRDQLFTSQIDRGIVPVDTTLTERPTWVPAWNELSGDQRRLYARQMECFAGYLSHTDDQIARLLDTLRQLGTLDDTIVVLISDNGTSAEGGPIGSHNEHRFTHDRMDDFDDSLGRIDDLGGFRAYNHYAWGWAWAGNTPFRLWKRYTWLGGVRTPLIVSWPSRLSPVAGQVRNQFCHAIDVMPTLLDAIGITPPSVVDGVEQQPIAGSSLIPAFLNPTDPDPRTTQYFEMLGSRAIYHDGWKATTDHVGKQISIERELVTGSHDFEADHWALFDLRSDFAESTDVSAEHPDIAADLQARWWAEAESYQVLPLDDSFIGRATALEPNPNPIRWRTRYLPGGGPIAEDALPGMGGGFVLHLDIEVGPAANGVICALGDWNNGWAVYLKAGVPTATFNLFGDLHRASASDPLTPVTHRITVDYRRHDSGGGPLTLLVDGVEVGSVVLPIDLPFRWQIGGTGLRIGSDHGFPVSDDYAVPATFDGTIHEVTIEIPAFAPRPDPATTVGQALQRE
ncbi:MAG: arylsulfatase [Mycobacterium sp.]|nr:MAG: arylsulfatase [Mycobacterium sp.]